MPKDPSKTEDPTQKRIQEARDEGNVLISQDITSFATLLGGLTVLWMWVPYCFDHMRRLYVTVLHHFDPASDWGVSEIQGGTLFGCEFLAVLLTPLLLGVFLVPVAVLRLQVGSYFSLKPLQWKLNKLNPVDGAKKLMPSKDNGIKMLLAMVKVGIVGVLVYFFLRGNMDNITRLPFLPLRAALNWVFWSFGKLIAQILVFYLVVAVLDYFWKRHQYYDNMKMTKQEVKDERKQSEGDPKVKGRIRSKMMEFSMMRMIAEIPEADVVVTNPTHVAVALRYTPGDYAPVVVAKGLRKRAERIKQIAAHHEVPTVEAPPLARSLYRYASLGAYIPEHLFGPVAAILAQIHRAHQAAIDKRQSLPA